MKEDLVNNYIHNLCEFNSKLPNLEKNAKSLSNFKNCVDELIKINKTALYNYAIKNKEKFSEDCYNYLMGLIEKDYI